MKTKECTAGVEKCAADPDWNDIRHFVALAEEGTLAQAGRRLGVAHATVARRVNRLEAMTGVQLFRRSADGFTLTAQGYAVFSRAREMRAQADGIAGYSADVAARTQRVRLTLTPALADHVVPELLRDMEIRLPQVQLAVIVDERDYSLSKHEADIAIRLGRPHVSSLVARRLGSLRMGVYGTADWATRVHNGDAPPLVSFDDDREVLPEAVWLRQRFPGAPLAFCANTFRVQLSAAEVGVGVTVLPRLLADGSERLCEIAAMGVPPSRDVWLVLRQEWNDSTAVTAVKERLVAWFESHPGL